MTMNPLDLNAPSTPSTPAKPANLHDVTTAAQFEELAKAAQGEVIVDFVQKDCESCDDEAPMVEALAARCPTTTVLKVDVDAAPELADRLKLWDKYGGTPTLLVAKTGADLLKGRVKEADPTDPKDRVLKRIKCAK